MKRAIAIAAAVLAAAAPLAAEVQVSTDDARSHSFPSVCANAAGFVAAWESRGNEGSDVTVQRLDLDGHPSGAALAANDNQEGDQQLPEIACRDDGGFVLVWESRDQDGDALGIFARSFDAAANAEAAEWQVNTYTTDNQRRPSLCISDDGSTTVVWDSYAQDGEGAGIYAQRYDADDQPLGGEVRVSDDRGGSQSDPSIACGDDGLRVIAWTQSATDSGADEVWVRNMDVNGDLSPTRRIAGGSRGDAHRHPRAAAKPNGDFLVAIENADATVALVTLSDAEITIQRIGYDLPGRAEAPIAAANARNDVFMAWARGSEFDFDLTAMRRLATPTDGDRLFAAANRPGNDGALSTLGRGIDIASAGDGDLLIWQNRDVFAESSASAIFVQRFKDCIGDCSGNGLVQINELIAGVRIALGQATIDDCAALDADGDGSVEIAELVRAVNEALASICPAPAG